MSCSFPEITGEQRLLIPLFFEHVAWIFPEDQEVQSYGDYSLSDDETHVYPSDLSEELRMLRTTYLDKYENMVLLMDEATPQSSKRVLLVGTNKMPGDLASFSTFNAEIIAERETGSERGVNWALLSNLVELNIDTAYALTVQEQIEEIMSTARDEREKTIEKIMGGNYSRGIGSEVTVKREDLVRHLKAILGGEVDDTPESLVNSMAGDGLPADAAIEPDETDPFNPA